MVWKAWGQMKMYLSKYFAPCRIMKLRQYEWRTIKVSKTALKIIDVNTFTAKDGNSCPTDCISRTKEAYSRFCVHSFVAMKLLAIEPAIEM